MRTILRNITVEPAMFSYFLAIYLLYSVFHPTVMDRVCTTYLRDLNSLTLPTNSCSIIFTMDTKEAREAVNHINKETNAWIQITTVSATIPSILVDCFMGGWSDLFGRKMPMYLPSVGGVLGSVVYLCFISIESMDPSWLCLASFLSGIFGGVTSVIANCFTYVASITDKESRTIRVSTVEAMQFLAASVGPFLSKGLKNGLGSVYVFAASLLCHIAVILYCITLKEPLKSKSDEERKITCAKLFSPKHLIDSFKTIFAPRPNKGRVILLLQLLCLFITMNIISGEHDILYVFLANINAANIFDYFFGFKNFMGAVALLTVLPVLKFLKLPDVYICLLGLFSYSVGLVTIGTSTSVSLVFLSGVLGMGARLADSILRSLVSQNVDEGEIGKIFGFVAVMGDTALIIGALVFNNMFTPLMNLTGMAGMAYIIASLALLVPLVILVTTDVVKRVWGRTTSPVSEGKHIYSNEGFTTNGEK